MVYSNVDASRPPLPIFSRTFMRSNIRLRPETNGNEICDYSFIQVLFFK